jgi:hypothetical protein
MHVQNDVWQRDAPSPSTLHLRREGKPKRRLADAAAAQAPLALSSVMQSVSNLGARLAAPDGVLPI